MAVRLNGGARATLRRQGRLDPMLAQDGDDGIPDSIVEILGGAAVEVGHLLSCRSAADARCRKFGISFGKLPGRQARKP